MQAHGIEVPKDAFKYSDKHPFVIALNKYRKAFTQLEYDNEIVHNKQVSMGIGYVDRPNDWVNDWSGRAYLKSS